MFLKTLNRKAGFAIFAAIAVALFVLVSPSTISAASLGKFYNPIMYNGADPWMTEYNGSYYLTRSGGGGVSIWESDSITGIANGRKVTVWTTAGTSFKDIWAPELHLINGTWYIYFAAAIGDDSSTRRMYVLQGDTSDPMGTYTFIGKVADPSDQWAIDGTEATIDGSHYFIWSGHASTTDTIQRLYIAPMDTPTHISGSRVLISSPTYTWENSNGNINEGPEVLQHNGKVMVIYSANGSWTNKYCLGMLTLTGTNPHTSSAWTKKSTPVFQSAGNVYGPGHASFTKSIDGTENWIVYHAAKYNGAGWTRNIRAQKFTWNSDNTPNFGTPISLNSAVDFPSGEGSPWTRYQAESADFFDAQTVNHTNASGGTVVGHIDNADSYLQFTVNVPVAGSYLMRVRYDNGTAGDSTHNIEVNGTASGSLTYTKTDGWNNFNIVGKTVTLQAGMNTIKFTKGTSFTEIDDIEIPMHLYQAEDATFFDAQTVNHTNASGGQVVGHIDFADSYLQFNVNAPTSGIYTLDVRYDNGTASTSTHMVSVNGGTAVSLSYPSTGSWNTMNTVTMNVSLNAGSNTIKFTNGNSFAEVDYVTITRQ